MNALRWKPQPRVTFALRFQYEKLIAISLRHPPGCERRPAHLLGSRMTNATQKLSSGAKARFGGVVTWGLKPPPPKEKARSPLKKAAATQANSTAGCGPVETFWAQIARLVTERKTQM